MSWDFKGWFNTFCNLSIILFIKPKITSCIPFYKAMATIIGRAQVASIPCLLFLVWKLCNFALFSQSESQSPPMWPHKVFQFLFSFWFLMFVKLWYFIKILAMIGVYKFSMKLLAAQTLTWSQHILLFTGFQLFCLFSHFFCWDLSFKSKLSVEYFGLCYFFLDDKFKSSQYKRWVCISSLNHRDSSNPNSFSKYLILEQSTLAFHSPLSLLTYHALI